MKAPIFASVGILCMFCLFLAGCSSDAVTDSLTVQYGQISLATEMKDTTPFLTANINVNLINRTERGMNVALLECAIYDAQTDLALIRFRPIIPQAYGSLTTVQLLPKQAREYPIVSPPALEAFDGRVHPKVVVKLSLQTTDGYRTEVASAPVAVAAK